MKIRPLLPAFALWLAPLLSAGVLPFTAPPDPAHLEETEGRLWAEAKDFDKALVNRGYIFPDPDPSAYLQEILDRLFPDYQGGLRVQVINDPNVNAFALPNGSLYLHVGLLARLENEAQVATVLAHEAGHVFHRHGYQQRKKAKNASAFALSSILVAGPIGLLGALGATSSIYGFSRDQEREADRVGFAALQRSGYDTRESIKVFQLLAEDASLQDSKQPVFFASHPKLQERIASFEEMCAQTKSSSGRTESSAFLLRTAPARAAWLEAELSLARPKGLLLVLGKAEAATRFGPACGYYRGSALELRNGPGDLALAETAYREALQSAPDFAPTYRSLGLLLYRRPDLPAARTILAEYLAMAPRASDAPYIAAYLARIDLVLSKTPPQEP